MKFHDKTKAALVAACEGEGAVSGRWVAAADALAADGVASLAVFATVKAVIRDTLVIPALKVEAVPDAASVWKRAATLPRLNSEAEAVEVAKVRIAAKAEGKDEAEAIASFKDEMRKLRDDARKVEMAANTVISRLKKYHPESRTKAEAEAKVAAEAEAKAKAEAMKMTAEDAEAKAKADVRTKAVKEVATVLTRLQKAEAGREAWPHLEAALAALLAKVPTIEGTATGPNHGADTVTPMGRPAGIAA